MRSDTLLCPRSIPALVADMAVSHMHCDLAIGCCDPYIEYWNPLYQRNEHDDITVEKVLDEAPDMSLGFVSFNREEREGSHSHPSVTSYETVDVVDATPEHGRFKSSKLKCSAVKMIPFTDGDDNAKHTEYEEHFSFLHTFDDLRNIRLNETHLNDKNLREIENKEKQLRERKCCETHKFLSDNSNKIRPLSKLDCSLKHFKILTPNHRQNMRNAIYKDILTPTAPAPCLDSNRVMDVVNAERWTQPAPAINTEKENLWKELSKSLTSLRLSRYKLGECEAEYPELTTTMAVNNDENNNDDVMHLKERSKSSLILDRVSQEQGRHVGKVN